MDEHRWYRVRDGWNTILLATTTGHLSLSVYHEWCAATYPITLFVKSIIIIS
jgi:hypothetical protein